MSRRHNFLYRLELGHLTLVQRAREHESIVSWDLYYDYAVEVVTKPAEPVGSVDMAVNAQGAKPRIIVGLRDCRYASQVLRELPAALEMIRASWEVL